MASINSATSGTTAANPTSHKGVGGLASGLDTDELVSSLTMTEKGKINKQEQEIQRLEWKQDAYREIITKMQEFEKKYLDILSPSNLRSASTFGTITGTSSSDAVSVTTNADSYATSLTIDYISQLATGKSIKTSKVSADLTGKVSIADTLAADVGAADVADTLVGKLAGKSISLTVDGTVKTISFDSAWAEDIYKDGAGNPLADPTAESFTKAFQNKLDAAFGAGRVTASLTAEGNMKLDVASSSSVSINAVKDDVATIEALGFSPKQSNKIDVKAEISQIATSFKTELATNLKTTEEYTEKDQNGKDVTKTREVGLYKFNINGVDFEFKDNTSLKSIMSEINASKAGVTLSYSDIDDTFTMVSKATGQSTDITMQDYSGADGESNFLASLGLTAADATVTDGQNAIFSANGTMVTRETNENIQIGGSFISLNATSTEAITLTMSEDNTDLKDMIVKFVEDYNEMAELINKARTEKRENDYAPLSDEQKKEMSESEIEKWEEKAKAGMLRNDSTLNSISSKLSSLMYTSFNGYSLYEMGIQSAGYGQNGKLTVDEAKLDTALATNSEKVKNFFHADGGFADSLKEVMDGAIKTSGPKGSRGSLIEKAGIGNTMSDTENSISEKIKDLQDFIKTLEKRLAKRESYWWNKFSALETLVNQMNSFSTMISSYGQMG